MKIEPSKHEIFEYVYINWKYKGFFQQAMKANSRNGEDFTNTKLLAWILKRRNQPHVHTRKVGVRNNMIQ